MTIYSILFLLLSNAATLRRDKSILYSRNGIVILIYCLIITLNNLNICLLEKGIGLFGGLFNVTTITQTFHSFIFLISGIIILLTAFYSRKVSLKNTQNLYDILFLKFSYNNTNIMNKLGQQFGIIEYTLVLLFIITGAIFLISSSDIVSIFLSIELQSYGLYLLSTLYRNSELSTSAGLTYFLLGGLSSCFILLGTSLLYANYGTTNTDGYYILNNITDFFNSSWHSNLTYKPFYLNTSLLIMSAGFLFKISAAPFHFWSPDVYDAIPTIVTTFVAIIAKISILVFLLGFILHTNDVNDVYSFNWKFALLLSSLLSLIVGTVLGLTQFRIKRLFAYSTISHLGFILLAICIGSLESVEAFIFYLIQYTISNLNAFFILIAMGYYLYTYVNTGNLKHKVESLQDRNNSPIQLISQLQGYFSVNPTLALSLGITLFSFVGIPPLIGFFAKQMVLSAALDSGHVFITLVAIITSVISAIYYLSVIKQIFFDKNEYKPNKEIEDIKLSDYVESISKKIAFNQKFNFNITLSNTYSITISILTLILLLFMYDPTNLLNLVLILSITISS